MPRTSKIAMLAVLSLAAVSQAQAGILCNSREDSRLGSAIKIEIPGNGIVIPSHRAGATVYQMLARWERVGAFIVSIKQEGLPVAGQNIVRFTAYDMASGGSRFFLTFSSTDYKGAVQFVHERDGLLVENVRCEITPEIERPQRPSIDR